MIGSFFNAVQAIGKTSGRGAEHALKRLYPDRIIFLSNIQIRLPDKAKLTRKEFSRMLDAIAASIQPPLPVQYRPVYEIANLVLAVQKATQEFHDRWKALLGMGSRANTAPEHWTRIKALTRRIGVFRRDEYDTLRQIADVIVRLQVRISVFLSVPLVWIPSPATCTAEDERVQATDAIRTRVCTRLHDLSHRRMVDEQLSGWVGAYERKGQGSSARNSGQGELAGLYESAAPVPNEECQGRMRTSFFSSLGVVAESIVDGGGDLRGWSRESLAEIG